MVVRKRASTTRGHPDEPSRVGNERINTQVRRANSPARLRFSAFRAQIPAAPAPDHRHFSRSFQDARILCGLVWILSQGNQRIQQRFGCILYLSSSSDGVAIWKIVALRKNTPIRTVRTRSLFAAIPEWVVSV
jgi:hypothetical protein